jgi:hypothetical protein
MINVLLFDTKKLTELYTIIGYELKRREETNISLTIISSNNLLVKGCNIGSKSEDIKYILGAFGKCSFEYTSLTDEIMFFFEDDRDLLDLISVQDSIIKKINDLFICKFKAVKGPIHLQRISGKKLSLSKYQILLQGEEIYDILRYYGPCEIIDKSSQNELIIKFLGSEDLDELLINKESVLNKIQKIFI